VQNKTFLTGQSRNANENYETAYHMQATDDEENANQVIRSIGTAFAYLKTALSEYLDEQGTTASNAQLSTTSNLSLTLQLPNNYNETTRETLAAAAHQYIVSQTISDFFRITNKADREDYEKIATASLLVMREAINSRMRPVCPIKQE